jgi:hypothetical protein
MTLLAILVTVLVFGPVLVIVPVILTLCAVGLFATDAPSRVRRGFECPVRHRAVVADFAVPLGAARPTSVMSCTAFADPSRVTCAQGCLDGAAVRWAPPPSVFAGWALVSDGVAGPDARAAA